LSACLSVAASICRGEDWPHFRGPNRDGKSRETGLLKTWPAEGLKPVWVADGLGEGYSGPSVAGGAIYVTGMVGDDHQGVLYAFDLTGKLQWKKPYGPEWSGMYPGTRATPTVDGDRVYLLSGTGRLTCFRAATGEELWSNQVAESFGGVMQPCGYAESVVIDGDQVICTPGGTNACFAALDKLSGKTVWISEGFTEQSAYCSPMVVERGDKRLLVTVVQKHVVGVNLDKGHVEWRHPQDPDAKDPNHSVSPVYDDGRIYVTSGHGVGGQMVKLSADGTRVDPGWTDEVLNTLHGGLIAYEGHVYGSNMHGEWVCIDLESGEVMYKSEALDTGSVTFADGMLYCYGEDGTMGLVKATPTGFDPSGRFKVTEGEGNHWSHPVISGGRLYIRHGDVLLAYGVKKR
jgi:outer membrane protein assembly factor BamB